MAAWDTSALPGTVTSARVGWYVRSPGPVHADTGVGHGKDSPRPQASSATVTATCAQTPRGGDCASPRAATHGTTSRRTMRSPHGRRPSLSGTTWARCRCARDGRRRPRRTAPRTSLTHRRPKTRQGGGGRARPAGAASGQRRADHASARDGQCRHPEGLPLLCANTDRGRSLGMRLWRAALSAAGCVRARARCPWARSPPGPPTSPA